MSDNPNAFPTHGGTEGDDARNRILTGGMTLRDYFATHAPEPPQRWWGGGMVDCAGYAKWNYQYADAMLEERQSHDPR